MTENDAEADRETADDDIGTLGAEAADFLMKMAEPVTRTSWRALQAAFSGVPSGIHPMLCWVVVHLLLVMVARAMRESSLGITEEQFMSVSQASWRDSLVQGDDS